MGECGQLFPLTGSASLFFFCLTAQASKGKQMTNNFRPRGAAMVLALVMLAMTGCGGGGDDDNTPDALPDVAVSESGCRSVSQRQPWGVADSRTWTPRQLVADDSSEPGFAVGEPFEARLVVAFGVDSLNARRQVVLELVDGCRRKYAVSSFSDADNAVVEAAMGAHAHQADPATYELLFEADGPTQSDIDSGQLRLHTTQHFAFWRGVDPEGESNKFVAKDGRNWDMLLQTAGDFMEQHWLLNRDLIGAPMPFATAAQRKKINVYVCGTGLPFIEGGDLADCGASAAESVWVSAQAMSYGSTLVHEFGHVIQFHSGGFRDKPDAGTIWETVAEWNANALTADPFTLKTYTDNLEGGPLFSPARYGAYPFISALFESDRTRDLVWQTWLNNNRTAEGATTEDYVPAFVRLAQAQGTYPAGFGSFADDVGWFGARLAAMDFEDRAAMLAWLKARDGKALSAKREVPLAATATAGVFASPAERPLLQYGTHLVPLTAAAGKVTVQLTGQTTANQAAWRFTLVSIAANGSIRYAAMATAEGLGAGATAIEHRPGESLYLAVTATPLTYETLGWQGSGPVTGTQFPYKVRFGNATPWTGSVTACNPAAGWPAKDFNYNTNGHQADGAECPQVG